jgi:hypothetical protein
MSASAAGQASNAVLKSVCHGCHGGCSVLLHVVDGELAKIEGDPDGPLNHGAICPIGVGARDLVYHPDRLKYPLRRKGPRGSGEWERITWDEALDTIVAQIRRIQAESGTEAIVIGTGTGRHHAKWVERFANALGTPNWCEPGTAQCFFPRVNVCHLTYGDLPVGDFTHKQPAECILYWGHNPLNSGPDGETRFASRVNLHAASTSSSSIRENELTKRADAGCTCAWHRRCARARGHARHHRRGTLRSGLRRSVVPRLRGAARARAAVLAGMGCADHLGAGGANPRGCATVCAIEAGAARVGLCHRAHAEHDPDGARRGAVAGADRQYRRAGRLGPARAHRRRGAVPARGAAARGCGEAPRWPLCRCARSR